MILYSDNNMSGPAKTPGLSTQEKDDVIESDLELDLENTDVVEPDNDPPLNVCYLCPNILSLRS